MVTRRNVVRLRHRDPPKGEPLLLVPTVLLDTTNLVVDSDVFGVRPLPVRDDVGWGVSWMPDSSAVAITLLDGSVQVVTIADAQYRTLIEDGAESSWWSPDGRQLAYWRAPVEVEVCDYNFGPDVTLFGAWQADEVPDEVWVAAADGTEARPVATSLLAPIWSPDGNLLLGAGPDGLFTVRPNGTGRTILTPNTLHPASPDGCPTTVPDTAASPGLSVSGLPAWQPLPPAADTGETTAPAATDE
jgi:hypothetical protein